MDKRTSDCLSFAAIVGGAGLGLGLTSLFFVSSAPNIVHKENVSVEVRVSTERPSTEHFAVIMTGEHGYRPVRTEVLRFRTDLDELERMRGNLVWGDTQMTFEINESYQGALEEYREALEGFEALEDLEGPKALEGLGGLQSLKFEILDRDEDEDERRRRRRRRPRQEAEVPDVSRNR